LSTASTLFKFLKENIALYHINSDRVGSKRLVAQEWMLPLAISGAGSKELNGDISK